MPNPLPLATKEEEERRAWVTAHHEVVRLIKDCFGDRFSNNEIFDRLKISRRTGYRALGNDERIGKAPGRKPKITEQTIKDMIEYIETGGCNDVGNVWKHLADKFCPDCNPKTVQDAVKKSGFKNYTNTVKLEPLLNEEIVDNQPTTEDEDAPQQPSQQQTQDQQPSPQQVQQAQGQQQQQQSQTQHQVPPSQSQQHVQQPHQNVIDPAFQQQNTQELLRQAIETSPDTHIRYVLWDLCTRFQEAERYTASILIPYVAPAPAPPVPQLTAAGIHPSLGGADAADASGNKRQRIAVCRRCGQQYDRVENTMDNRSCLYHKGSPQKISPDEGGTIEQSPEAYIWSCCGGNGMVRGCCRAMHTTKKKRKYGKKRDATEAGLDGANGAGENDDDGDGPEEGDTTILSATQIDSSQLDNPNIDASLQGLQESTAALPSHMAMQIFNGDLQPAYTMAAADAAAAAAAHDHLQLKHESLQQPPHPLQPDAQIPPDMQTQLHLAQAHG